MARRSQDRGASADCNNKITETPRSNRGAAAERTLRQNFVLYTHVFFTTQIYNTNPCAESDACAGDCEPPRAPRDSKRTSASPRQPPRHDVVALVRLRAL